MNALSQSISDGCFWQFQNSSLQLYLKIDPGRSCWISTSRYSKKYLKYSSIRTRSSHSKMFIYLKFLKTFCEEVNSYWSCEIPPWKFTKKALSHIFLHAFCLHFLRRHHNYFLWSDFEGAWAQFLSGNTSEKCKLQVSLVIYQFNYDSSKSPFFMFNMAFDVVLSTVFFK